MPEPQNFKNHSRRDPASHLIAFPILAINLFVWIGITIHDGLNYGRSNFHLHLWLVIVSFALLVLAVNSRMKDLKVQDRVIRLEEHLRFAALLPPATLAQSGKLTVPQIVALRFVADEELPAMVARTLMENLTPKQIKAAINSWRPDLYRV